MLKIYTIRCPYLVSTNSDDYSPKVLASLSSTGYHVTLTNRFKKMNFSTLTALVIVATTIACSTRKQGNEKIESLLKQMTLEEKIALIHGDTYFTTPAIPRLGIPVMNLSDGPCGIREENNPSDWGSANWPNDSTAYFPSLSALASTWNAELATLMGKAYGEEAKIRNKQIALMPGINIHRSPLNGRNWEYMSEDPYLVSTFAPLIIKSVQSSGVACCVKHYALNNQETNRNWVNVEVDERALREIYLPGFEAAVVEGGALSVMGAYNKFRGQYASHNQYLLNDILKGEWGFKGFVVSDWDAAHNTMEAAHYGLDLEMGTNVPTFDDYYMARPLLDSVKAGKVSEEVINEKVRRILYVMNELNMLDGPVAYDTTGMQAKLAAPHRREASLKVAEEAVVLLKNEKNILPLNVGNLKSIAVIGDNATLKHSHGGGSTIIKARYEVTPLEGILGMIGPACKVNYAKGYNRIVKDGWKYHDTTDAVMDKILLDEAVQLAKKSDIVIFVGGYNHDHGLDCESADKNSIRLPYKQDELIAALLKANPNTIVALNAGGPVDISAWDSLAPTLLTFSYLGSEAGIALANVLLGKVNPSGKLATTWPKHLQHSPDQAIGEFPGKDGVVRYLEGLLVGYRYYDTKNVEPRFPFGFGLSYTDFEISNLSAPLEIKANEPVTVTMTVKNTGKAEGKEVIQLYVRDVLASFERPLKELKGFAKVSLTAGESKTITITLTGRAFSFYNPEKKDWVTESGEFELLAGTSSRNIRRTHKLVLK